jgi:hypothetical protein
MLGANSFGDSPVQGFFPVISWTSDPNAPTVFISYSQDQDRNGNHRRWVVLLAKKLSNLGIKVDFDVNFDGSKDLGTFMQEGIQNNNYIICVCSESYVKKTINARSSGVREEYKLILKRSKKQDLSSFVFPIIKDGSRKKNFPRLPRGFKKVLYRSFERNDIACESFARIAARILNVPDIINRYRSKQIRFSLDTQTMSDELHRRLSFYWATELGSKEEKKHLKSIEGLFDKITTPNSGTITPFSFLSNIIGRKPK